MKQRPIRRQPILTIDVLELDYQSSTINLIRPGYPERRIVTSWGYGNLAEYYESYRQGLESFKQELRTDRLDQDFAALTSAFKKLFKPGTVLFESLFDDISGQFEDNTVEIINYLRDHIIAASSSRQLSYPQTGLIEVRTKTIKDIVPVECLVIIGSKPKVESWQDLDAAISGILGFSFIVNRVIRRRPRQSQKRELNNVPRLPLKYFCDQSLDGAIAERDFFRDERYFRLDGPWPGEDALSRGTESVEKDLVWHLFRPDVGFYQTDKTDAWERQLDEVHHISCHCYTDEEYSFRCSLQFTGCQPFTLMAMRAHLANLKHCRTASQTTLEMPLVFFNACGSSKLTPKGITSFPEYFLMRNGNCGFIGSETRVPDLFASEFCRQFYLHLLRGCGVGEAIFRARYTMLRRYRNPLGILYTSYVDPYLRVTRTVDSSARR